MSKFLSTSGLRPIVIRHGLISGRTALISRPQSFRPIKYYSSDAPRPDNKTTTRNEAPKETKSVFAKTNPSVDAAHQSMPPGWEDNPDLDITAFSELPHRFFGTNQHIRINEDFKESLRQILWQFRAPIRYAFAYGSGVFSQGTSSSGSSSFSPHPHPPEAVTKWQQDGGKMIDFIFGVSYTEHWHSINLQEHKDHYSFLKWGGSGPISKIQDNLGAGVYFNPYVITNGIMIKYGVVNLDTICRDLTEWDTLYLAGRLQKPVKILRDDPRVRLANQMNLMSAVRTALLMLPERFSEKQLYEKIAGMSYLGDPRMTLGGENPRKVSNIVSNQLPNFRQLYVPLIDSLPNVAFHDRNVPTEAGWEREDVIARSGRNPKDSPGETEGFMMQQDMDPIRRGNMVRRLPKGFRQKLYYQYQKKFQIPGSAFDKIIDEAADEDATGLKRRQGGEFEQRIGQQDDLDEVVSKCIHNTISWPSTSQSVKSFFTAGFGRSWKYYQEKRSKNRAGKSPATEKTEDAKVETKNGKKNTKVD
ncbi:hypothetical protein MBLNU457_4228t1 [Dothideomycetes sp. NU457]